MDKFRFHLSLVQFTLALAIYFALVLNAPLYKDLLLIVEHADAIPYVFLLSVPILLIAALNIIFSAFTWPGFAQIFFALLTIVSSIVSYAAFNYGSIFDYYMIENIVETNTQEATSYLSLKLIVWILSTGITPAILMLYVKIKSHHSFIGLIKWKFISAACSFLVILAIASIFYKDYASMIRNHDNIKKGVIPNEFVYSAFKYANQNYWQRPRDYLHYGEDAQLSFAARNKDKPLLVVFILGETARSMNYTQNGYQRITNPYTKDLEDLISFVDVRSCGTSTAYSVPCMFSPLKRSTYDRSSADNMDNVLDVLQRAKVNIIWRDNDGGDKGVAKHIEQKYSIDSSMDHPSCNGSTCYDQVMLESFVQDIKTLKADNLIVYHLIGSHGPTYYQRYPSSRAHFLPDCQRADIENCSAQAIVNSFDNTIINTDHFIHETITKLQSISDSYQTALIYVSDHGESLGENGIYLHGLPYSIAPIEQTKVPLLAWFSPSYQEQHHLDLDCVKKLSAKRNSYSHDNLYSTVLGLFDVETSTYVGEDDLFKECKINATKD